MGTQNGCVEYLLAGNLTQENNTDSEQQPHTVKSLIHKHLKHNLADVGFDTFQEGFENLMVNSDDALFFTTEWYLDTEYNFMCNLIAPWKSSIPSPMSFAFPKESPYFPFFNYHVIKMREMGELYKLDKKWIKRFDDKTCKHGADHSLGYFKLIGLFGILGVGMTVAVLTGSLEVLLKCKTIKDVEEAHSSLDQVMLHKTKKLKDLSRMHGVKCSEEFINEVSLLFLHE